MNGVVEVGSAKEAAVDQEGDKDAEGTPQNLN